MWTSLWYCPVPTEITLWYFMVPSKKEKMMERDRPAPRKRPRRAKSPGRRPNATPEARCGSILGAAFSVLMERGYAGASTLEIARRARVSKRELYAAFGSKEGILAALM